VKDIKGLTGLRGYAALMVCLHHFNYRKSGTLFFDIVAKGDWGVIVFFVLSGFVLAYVYQEWFKPGFKITEYYRFIRLRLARVYPLHLLMLLLWGLFIVYGRIAVTDNDTPFTFFLNLTLTHAWGFTRSLSWNLPSWSISSEFFCYLLFPFLMLLARLGRGYIVLLMAFSLVEPLYHPYAHFVKLIMDSFNLIFAVHQFEYGVSLIDWFCTFAFGVFIFLLLQGRNLLGGLRELFFMLGCGLFFYVFSAGLSDNDEIRLLISLASALFIVSAYYEGKLAVLVFGNPVAVFLGLISYALYLSHIILQQVMSPSWPLWLHVICALIVSSAIHYLFERPCRSWLRSRL